MPLKSLSPLFGKKVLLLTHAGCDVDSFASAAAMQLSLGKKAKCTIGVPDHLNLYAKKFADSINAKYSINPSLWGFDAIVCVDFNKAEMLGSLRTSFGAVECEKFVIDHHSTEGHGLAAKKNSLLDKSAVSSTELVYKLLKSTKGVKVPGPAYACIAAGIMTDSAGFMVAGHNTFSIMSQVMKAAGMNYSKIASMFYLEKNVSETIAILKSAKRARLFRGGDSLIAISEIGAFEADAASSLVRLGCSVAFCGYADKGRIRVSGRANNNWLSKKRFDLSHDIFNPLEKFFDGEGGGHPGAAGFNGKGDDVKPCLEKCCQLVCEFLSRSGEACQLKELDG